MKKTIKIVVIALIMTMIFCKKADALWAQAIKINSPDGNLSFIFTIADGDISYCVEKGTTTIIDDSKLGITTSVADFTSGLSLSSSQEVAIYETAYNVKGKASTVVNSCNQGEFVLSKGNATLKIYARVYNDGVAFRYYIPGSGSITISSESTEVNLPDGTGGWGFNWRSDYEGMYEYKSYSQLNSGSYAMPLLASIYNNSYWALLTEANVYNSSGSYCTSHLEGSSGQNMKYAFAPEQTNDISTSLPFQTPYRVVLVTDNLNDLVESNLVYNVNPGTSLSNVSWIDYGKAAWSWWSEERSPQWYLKQKKYVDFASRNGWEYVTVDAGWDDTWVENLCDYADTKNVGIIIWTDVDAIDTQSEINSKLTTWASWGVKGIKVDFMMNDSQDRMWTYQAIAEKAATLGMVVNFHGSTKPSGENKTYPNIITSEGIRGSEHYKWSDYPNAYHNCTVPFTRNVVGGMDYTPVVISTTNANTTQAHQLALSVVFESGMQHFADSVDVYEPWKGLSFLNAVPTVWDETRLLEGYPGNYITIARRSGQDWYIGAITNNSRTATIDLSFLGSGTYTAYIYKDGSRAEYIDTQSVSVTSASQLNVNLSSVGGCAILITKSSHSLGNVPDPNYTYYEAESNSNSLSGQASVVSCDSCSGGYKVGNLGGSASSTITFNNINVSQSGSYELRFYYLTQDSREFKISVNNGSPITVTPEISGSFYTVRASSVFVQLNSGNNTISFADTGYAPDLDKIGIRKASDISFTKYEAENAQIVSPAQTYGSSVFSGGYKVGYIGYNGYITFNQVNVSSSGDYLIQIYYATSGNRDLYVSCNNGTANKVICFDSGSFDSIEYKEILVHLNAGNNTIKLFNSNGYAPDIDFINVSTSIVN